MFCPVNLLAQLDSSVSPLDMHIHARAASVALRFPLELISISPALKGEHIPQTGESYQEGHSSAWTSWLIITLFCGSARTNISLAPPV